MLNNDSLIVDNSRDTVSFTPLTSYHTAGDSLTLECAITAYQLSPVITTRITSYLKHNSMIVNSSIFTVTVNGSYKFSWTTFFNNVELSNAGKYTCTYFLSNNSFVQSSDVKPATVDVRIKSELIL